MPKNYSIVGQKHKNIDAYLVGILPGTTVTLVREPENPYDKNAIAVWINGKKVGFIPMKQNAALAAFIDQSGSSIGEVGIGASATEILAMDAAEVPAVMTKAVLAKFIRSPNSSYPMVEV